jgi:hypothetical protein
VPIAGEEEMEKRPIAEEKIGLEKRPLLLSWSCSLVLVGTGLKEAGHGEGTTNTPFHTWVERERRL